MGAYDYTKLASTANSMIARFGRTMVKRSTIDGGDVWNPTQTIIDSNIIGVITNFKANEIDGTLILKSDKQLITVSLIDITDKIVDQSIQYSVINVDTIQPANTPLLYKVQIRR